MLLFGPLSRAVEKLCLRFQNIWFLRIVQVELQSCWFQLEGVVKERGSTEEKRMDPSTFYAEGNAEFVEER